MKIALCGSLNFVEEMERIKKLLTKRGHKTFLPDSVTELSIKTSDDAKILKNNREKYMEIKPDFMKKHFDKILNCDAILVVNITKNGIENYIGGNTFAEIMFAFYHNKKIFFLNPPPKDERLFFITDEIESIKPIVLNGNLELIGE